MSRQGGFAGGSVWTVRSQPEQVPSLRKIMEKMGLQRLPAEQLAQALPFSAGDTTAGAETELQAAVIGRRSDIDLPITIEQSNYFVNILRRTAAGDTPPKVISELEKVLATNYENVWENSWVRFPRSALSPFANDVFKTDLLADKKRRDGALRTDSHKFIFQKQGEEHLRVPLSYLLKLALADVISVDAGIPPVIHKTGCGLMDHFLSDNTSPETHSFRVVPLRRDTGMGRAIAREAATRFLFTQLLIMYANRRFLLTAGGQKAVIFSSPHPPLRQKRLNDCISDAFYRELFMNPCLSGWDRGESKHDYMHLCHGVLSRSQLNAVAKLKEAGILTSNLVVLPHLSNISLANNGTHLSLGSVQWSRLLSDPSSGVTRGDEKYVGDLVIKIVEHFLPLFIGTYSAAPHRLDFHDFHPEKVLGFLPHELDYTHLRMFWRRWKKKAHIKILGRPLTPFGPPWLDRVVSSLFVLRGDFVPDFRLIDYPVMLMSTERSPALDGRIGNSDRLKRDLSDLGIFDTKMSLYILYKLREWDVMGFSGFEGRHYSLFHDLEEDMGRAADLQNLITALAFKYIATGKVTHAHIPDNPFVESERRQILFGSAAGIPTFFVRHDTGNAFLHRLIRRTSKVRQSRRYPGYLRVHNLEYQKALARVLVEDAGDLMEMLGFEETLRDLQNRLEYPDVFSAAAKLTQGILGEAGAQAPLKLNAEEFNRAAETYYRGRLRENQIKEAFQCLERDLAEMDRHASEPARALRQAVRYTLGDKRPLEFLAKVKDAVIEDRISLGNLVTLIHLFLIHVYGEKCTSEPPSRRTTEDEGTTPPVCGTGNG